MKRWRTESTRECASTILS